MQHLHSDLPIITPSNREAHAFARGSSYTGINEFNAFMACCGRAAEVYQHVICCKVANCARLNMLANIQPVSMPCSIRVSVYTKAKQKRDTDKANNELTYTVMCSC